VPPRWMTILLVAVALTISCTRRPEVVQAGGDAPRHAEAPPPGVLEPTIATPEGDLKISDIRFKLRPYYLSRIVLYPAPQRTDGRETVVNDAVYLVKADAEDPDWFQVATRAGSLSWIDINEVDRKDHYHQVDLYPD
jgi:hypothetical protein